MLWSRPWPILVPSLLPIGRLVGLLRDFLCCLGAQARPPEPEGTPSFSSWQPPPGWLDDTLQWLEPQPGEAGEAGPEQPHAPRRAGTGLMGQEDLVQRILMRGMTRDNADDAEWNPFAGAGTPTVSVPAAARLVSRGTQGSRLDASLAAFRVDEDADPLLQALFGEDTTSGSGLQDVLEQSKQSHWINQLPRERYQEKHKHPAECELCLGVFKAGDELMRLPCMHVFHVKCVGPWLGRSSFCPVCQTDLCEAAGL